ncbi:MAG: hypothetical protein CMO55_07725 [Verrucomicrobiales bacterium]|nr:hypothetical protein [Verrucomicrobiales bacterium]
MIDTIGLRPSILPAEPVEDLLRNRHPDWSFWADRIAHSHLDDIRIKARGKHRQNEVFVAFDEHGKLVYVQANLPRLLHLSRGKDLGNGIQIKTPEELVVAKASLLQTVRWFRHDLLEKDLPLGRLDLAATLAQNPRVILPVHRHARHPRIRRETQSYYNLPPEEKEKHKVAPHVMSELNTVRFHGTYTTISIYDKVREALRKIRKPWPKEIDCVRVEIQLHRLKKIAEAFGMKHRKFLTLEDLDFELCYRGFRSLLCQFQETATLSDFDHKIESYIAILENHPETWYHFGNLSPLDHYRITKNPAESYFKGFRRRVGGLQMQFLPFQWSEILPEDRLPELVDVTLDGREIHIPSPWSFA